MCLLIVNPQDCLLVNQRLDLTCKKGEICPNSSLVNVQNMLLQFKMYYLLK